MNAKTLTCAMAGLAFAWACPCAFADIVEGRDPQQIYISTYAQARSTSPESKQHALEKAELAALDEFVRYALRENLILPDSLARLESKIKNAVYFKHAKGEIKGANVLESSIQADGRAACLLEVPKANLENFKALDVREAPLQILNFMPPSKLLPAEVTLELGEQLDPMIWGEKSPLTLAMSGKPLEALSPLWLHEISLSADILSLADEDVLLSIAEAALALPSFKTPILEELKKRDYIKIAHFLESLALPCKESLPACDEFLTTVPADAIPSSPWIQILAAHHCAIDFAHTYGENKPYEEALSQFMGMDPDFEAIKKLLFQSFLIQLRDDSLNLLGRCYEEEAAYTEAIMCYFQTYSLNPNNEYVKWNLAHSFYAMENKEQALFWAKEVQQDQTSSPQTKKEAGELIKTIEEDITSSIDPT